VSTASSEFSQAKVSRYYLEERFVRVAWKVKSNLFWVGDALNGPALLYFLQRNVTRRAQTQVGSSLPIRRKHRCVLVENGRTGTILEFGLGKSLEQNLFASSVVGK